MSVDHAELDDRHAEELLRFLARRTLDPQAALDLVGETFAAAGAARRRSRRRRRGDAGGLRP